MEMFRRTAGLDAGPHTALGDAELWAAHGRAARAMGEVERLAERIVATSARQRAHVDVGSERVRDLVARADAVAAGLARVREALERLDVVALNAALEGARSNEPLARGLVLVADEVRGHVARGLDATREARGALEQAEAGSAEAADRLERADRDGAEIGGDAAQLKNVAQEALAGFSELEGRLRKATGLDPETARLVAVAGEHARGLAASLSALEGSRALDAVRALSPLLSPLSKLLAALPSAEPPPSQDDD
jgi:hypothetical protein